MSKSIKDIILEYHKIYNEKIKSKMSQYEYVRKDLLKEFYGKCLLFSTPMVLTLIFVGYAYYCDFIANIHSDVSFYLMMMIGALFPFTIWAYVHYRDKYSRQFASILKEKMLADLLRVFGDIEWIGHDKSEKNTQDVLLNDEELDKSGLFINFNTRYTDDEFTGVFNGVPFIISETNMLYINKYGKNKEAIEVFKGVIVSFKFNKIINNRTTISTKGDLTKKNQGAITAGMSLLAGVELFKDGYYAHWKVVLILIVFTLTYLFTKYIYKTTEEALDEVKLEDPVFNKRFNVYSSDQVEARYLVTPAFMKRFYDLKVAFKSKNIKCSFYGDKLMIAINTDKNLFEIGNLFKTLNDPSSINDFFRELNSIYSMVEYFKLDEKIYTTN